MKKKSDLLYKELEELEEKFLPFKLVCEEEAIGLTVKAVHTIGNLHDHEGAMLVVFNEGKAIFYCNGYVDTLPILIRSYYDDWVDREGNIRGPKAWMEDFSRWMYSLHYANAEVGEQMLAKAKEREQAIHDESIHKEIQKKVAELKALTDKLK